LNQPSSSSDTEDEGADDRQSFGDDIQFEAFDVGMRVMAIKKYREAATYDLIITDIVSGSQADQKGLQEGFKIRKVGNQRVEDLETLRDLISEFSKEYESVPLTVETREGATQRIELQP
jgi:S1-C subfamily serine protease